MFTDERHPSADLPAQQPNTLSIGEAEGLARRSPIYAPELDWAIEAKVGHEQLGEPEGPFFPLETEIVTELGNTPRVESEVVRVGVLREFDGRVQVSNAHRELDSIGGWSFGSRYVKASGMTDSEAARDLGSRKYSEVGRYKVVGPNVVARLADGKLVLAPDTPLVRSSLEAANFKVYGSGEIDDEYGSLTDDTWGGFSLNYVPTADEVPIEPANGHYVVSTAWRKVKAEWRQHEGVQLGVNGRTVQAVGGVVVPNPTRVYSKADVAEITGSPGDISTRTRVLPIVKVEDRFTPERPLELGDMNLHEVAITANRAVDQVAGVVGRMLEGMVGLDRETDVLETFKELDDDMLEVLAATLAFKVGRGDPTDPEIKQAELALALVRQIQKAKKDEAGRA